MLIPIVLKDGGEELVSKNNLQYLLMLKKVIRFKRSDGWVVVGQDIMRKFIEPYNGEERRHIDFYAL
jgi:hypothetical protein